VTSSYGTPNGTVSFRDGARIIGTMNLTAGATALTTSSLVSGTHSITATYNGDTNYIAATSAALTQSVNLPADSLKLRALQIAATRIAAQNSGPPLPAPSIPPSAKGLPMTADYWSPAAAVSGSIPPGIAAGGTSRIWKGRDG
jgi:hypothetical protein